MKDDRLPYGIGVQWSLCRKSQRRGRIPPSTIGLFGGRGQPMRRFLLFISIAMAFGCSKDPSKSSSPPATGLPSAKAKETRTTRRINMNDFFVQWLKGHGHDDVVVDANGVGVRGNATRLRASLYGSNPDAKGFVVELEFTIRLPSGQVITEFLAGLGDTEEQAIKDAQLNFVLTTFHVVYKGFINDADPHMTLTPASIKGVNRNLIMGDIFVRGVAPNKDTDFNAMNAEIQGVLMNYVLTPGSHWIKIVYVQNDGEPMTVAVTLDNADHLAMAEAVKRLNWPRMKGFYMAKQFIVVK